MDETTPLPPDEMPPPAPADKPVNKALIAHVATIAALVIGSLTPWITIFGIGLSGVSIHYGIVSLVAAGLLALMTYLSTRTTSPRSLRLAGAGTAIAGAASLASVIYVGWAIRSSFADDASDDSIGASFAAAFRPHLGLGLWLVFGGAVLALLIGAPVALNRKYSTRTLAAIAVGTLVLGGGGVAVADQKAQSDQRKAAAAAKAKSDAEAKAEADREAAEAAAEAQRQADEEAATAAAEAQEAADREKYKVVMTSCASDAYGFTTDAKGKITNESGKSRTYSITVRMLDKSGDQVGTAEDYVNDVPAGATATWSGSGFGEGIAKCEPPTVEVSEF